MVVKHVRRRASGQSAITSRHSSVLPENHLNSIVVHSSFNNLKTSLGRNISIKSSFPNRNLSILKWNKKLVQTFWKLTFYLYKSNFWSKLIYSSKFLIHNLCMKGVDLKYKLHHKLDALWLALHLDLCFQTFNIYNSIHLNLHTLEPPTLQQSPSS